jgi:hypothetical protein
MSMIHPDDLERIEKSVHNSLSTGGYDIQYRIIRGDGQIRYIHGRGAVIYDTTGNPIKWSG